jgi:hypothetical protein
MSIPRWKPSRVYTFQEKALLKRLKRTRKLFAFLRNHRHELFDDAFQSELETMYRDTGAGKPPVPPAMMAMAVLLQGYLGASDAEAVEMTVVDLRWQLVLGRLGAAEPAFSQGALQQFRKRMIQHDMDRRLLERTVELARRTKEFSWKALPKSLHVAMDSAPLQGAGAVEDTLNLIGHAARQVVRCAAVVLGRDEAAICKEAKIPVLLATSIKAGLDRDWTDPFEKQEAVKDLAKQVQSLQRWVDRNFKQGKRTQELVESLESLAQVIAQDLEPDPDGAGPRVKHGVAKDRRISIQDPQMRHGRKSKSKTIDGFKQHVADEIVEDLILACALTGANQSDAVAVATLKEEIERQGLGVGELYIDRQYLNSPVVHRMAAEGLLIICRPRTFNSAAVLLNKSFFDINIRDRTITCPAGKELPFRLGATVHFNSRDCDACVLRSLCTTSAQGKGRSVSVSEDEPLQKRLRKLASSPRGRRLLRKRVHVEHQLAHIQQRKGGGRARYFGVRDNLFDLRRAATIQNLEAIQRKTNAWHAENDIPKAA